MFLSIYGTMIWGLVQFFEMRGDDQGARLQRNGSFPHLRMGRVLDSVDLAEIDCTAPVLFHRTGQEFCHARTVAVDED